MLSTLRISIVFALLIGFLPLVAAHGTLIDIVVFHQPRSACDGSLKELIDFGIAAQPDGYLSPVNHRKRLQAEGRMHPNYRAEYREKMVTRLGGSNIKPRIIITPITELPRVKLIFASERIVHNALLGRASSAIEENEFLNDLEFIRSDSIVSTGGHDLQKSELIALSDLLKLGRRTISEDSQLNEMEIRRLNVEQQFWQQWMNPELQRNETDVFVSSDAEADALEVVGHELLHAQFFTQEPFRNAVFNYYDHHVSEQDRKDLVSALIAFYGNIHRDRLLAANELMAYTLQPNSEKKLEDLPDFGAFKDMKKYLIPLVQKHQKPLRDFLADKGLTPIEVKF